jgi:uncharacterized membrane protein YagU involved in acid resistance
MIGKSFNAKVSLVGGFAGFIATVPMTVVMEWLYRRLPWHERYPLPPSQIVSSLTDDVTDSEHRALTLAGHFSYGTAMGVVYAWVFHRLPFWTFIKGSVFGFLVWTGSYLGWLPALQILTPATNRPLRRNLLMIFAHFVWGSVTARLVEKFT